METKRVLIVEDEPLMAQALAEGLRRSLAFKFEVTTAKSPRDCLAQQVQDIHFDVCLVDLQLAKNEQLPTGHRIVVVRAFDSPDTLVVVYSAYPSTSNIVRAVKSGAVDFISKIDCAPHEVPVRIVQLIEERRRGQARQQEFADYVREHADEWMKTKAGQVLVIVGKSVVASGASRLEALIEYEEKRSGHPDWRDDPDVIDIPKQ